MKKFISKIGLFSLLLLVVSISIDYSFTMVFKNGNTNKTQWLSRINNRSFDVAILGNSRSWWNIDLNLFNKELELNCISLSDNHFPYSEMLLRLKQFYSNNNSMKLLLLQTEYWSLFNQEQGFSMTVYDNIPYLDDSTTYNYLSLRSDEWKKLKYIPLWRYAEFNRQWGIEEFLITLLDKRNTIFDSTGTFFSNNKFYGNQSINFSPIKSFKINPDFIAIYKFCKSHDIRLCAYTAPIYNVNFHRGSQQRMEIYFDSLGVEYRNYMNTFQDSSFFNDNTHLSISGGKYFTDTLLHYTKLLIEHPY